jgi:two-component system chemotaxis response regulator CheB
VKCFPSLHLGGDIKYKKDIVVIGTSAGGVEALSNLVSYFPSDLDAAIFVVLHIPTYATSVLPQILNRAGKLPASHPQDNEEIRAGHIYIAPPDYHLLVEPGYISLLRGPKENSHRPAIDPLFRSAARAYGKRVVGVVLTGMLDDGTAGLQAVKMCGGTAIVQSPEDAIYKGMPRSAIRHVEDIDYILPLSEIPQTLVELANTPVEAKANNPVSHQMEI